MLKKQLLILAAAQLLTSLCFAMPCNTEACFIERTMGDSLFLTNSALRLG